MVDRLRTIDPREVQRDFSCDVFVERGLRSQILVNGEIGFAFLAVKKASVSVATVCDRTLSVQRGKGESEKDSGKNQGNGIGALVLILRPEVQPYLHVGNLRLTVETVNERGAFFTLSSSQSLSVEKVDPTVSMRELLETKVIG